MTVSNEARKISFHGEGGTLLGIHMVNLFLALVTLGVYFFWGRVKLRNYLWGQMEFEGDRLSYHGTGKETFLGWLKAMGFFIIPYVILKDGPAWIGAGKILIAVGALLSGLLILVFIPMAVIGTRRYRLSRTAWRGIRFSFREHWRSYMPLFLKGGFLNLITLGLYSPYYTVKREKFLIANTYVGNQNFDFDGKGEDLFKSFIKAWLLFIPTLGLSFIWYAVKKTIYIWDHTTFGGSRFQCYVTFGGMVKVSMMNMLLVLFTLGFGYSWAQVRSINYLVDHLTLNGPADFETLQQEAQSVNATGEELGSFLDMDFDLG